MKKLSPIYIIGFLIAFVLAWIVSSRLAHQHPTNNPIPQKPSVAVPTRQPKPEAAHEKMLTVYRIVVKGDQAQLQAVEAKPIPGKTPYESALIRLITEGDAKGTANPIPEGTKLLSLNVKDDLAEVNFSKEFQDNFNGGSEGESLTVDSILRTLGQFPGIKRVQIMVEGKPLDSLGHLDLSKPLDINDTGSESGGKN